MRRQRRSYMPARGRLFILFIFLILLIALFNMQIKPIMEAATSNESKILAVNVINEAVLNELEKNSISYSDLINVSRSSDGSVQSITTNVIEMNKLKAKILNDVQNKLGSNTYLTVWIPYGTLIGNDIFYGHGPKVPLKVVLTGNVTANFKSTFASAGINQTRHQIYLDVRASVYSFLPCFKTTTDVSTNVLVAETVIVGSVPQVVANIK